MYICNTFQKADYTDKFYPNLGEMNMLVVLLIVLAVCAVIGVAQTKAIVSFFKVPLIATLGMQTLVYGLCLVYTGAKPIGGLKRNYTLLSTSGMFENRLPYIILIAFGRNIHVVPLQQDPPWKIHVCNRRK